MGLAEMHYLVMSLVILAMGCLVASERWNAGMGSPEEGSNPAVRNFLRIRDMTARELISVMKRADEFWFEADISPAIYGISIGVICREACDNRALTSIERALTPFQGRLTKIRNIMSASDLRTANLHEFDLLAIDVEDEVLHYLILHAVIPIFEIPAAYTSPLQIIANLGTILRARGRFPRMESFMQSTLVFVGDPNSLAAAQLIQLAQVLHLHLLLVGPGDGTDYQWLINQLQLETRSSLIEVWQISDSNRLIEKMVHLVR